MGCGTESVGENLGPDEMGGADYIRCVIGGVSEVP